MGTSRVRLLPTGNGDMALKPPFFSLISVLRYRGPRPPRPYRGLLLCRPLYGLPYPWVSGDGSIDA